jgi:hypothetical protein
VQCYQKSASGATTGNEGIFQTLAASELVKVDASWEERAFLGKMKYKSLFGG